MIATSHFLMLSQCSQPIKHRSISSSLPRNRSTIKDIYSTVIRDCEEKRPRAISVLVMSQERGIPHRRLYDLFNILGGLGITRNEQRGQIVWEGVHKLDETIEDAIVQIYQKSIHESIKSIFEVGMFSSMGDLAKHFIGLYAYLGVTSLPIHESAILFSSPNTQLKTLERKLYLVLNVLEILGWVKHVKETAEFKLAKDLRGIIQRAESKKLEYIRKEDPTHIYSLLNKPSVSLFRLETQHRRQCFVNLM